MDNNYMNRTSVNNSDLTEDTIDVLDLIKYLWSKVLILILAFIVGAMGAGVYTAYFITPQYQASSMVYIFNKSASIASIADLEIGSQITADFQIIAKTREVIDASTYAIGLNVPYEAVVGKVSISNPGDSRILRITVTDSDPKLAADLSNSIAHQLSLRVADVMSTQAPSVVEAAVVPKYPVGPNIRKNVILGGAGLMTAFAAVIVVLYLLDDSIKNEDDIEKYLKLNVVASVPLVAGSGYASSRKKGIFNKKRRRI